MAGELRAVHMLVGGRVQGVGYRQWSVKNAGELGVFGWVRNLEDGRVEIHVEGEGPRIDTMVQRCKRGPWHAEVKHLEVEPCDIEAHSSFVAAPTAANPTHS